MTNIVENSVGTLIGIRCGAMTAADRRLARDAAHVLAHKLRARPSKTMLLSMAVYCARGDESWFPSGFYILTASSGLNDGGRTQVSAV